MFQPTSGTTADEGIADLCDSCLSPCHDALSSLGLPGRPIVVPISAVHWDLFQGGSHGTINSSVVNKRIFDKMLTHLVR